MRLIELRPGPMGWLFPADLPENNGRRRLPERTLLLLFEAATASHPALVLDLERETELAESGATLSVDGGIACDVANRRALRTKWRFVRDGSGIRVGQASIEGKELDVAGMPKVSALTTVAVRVLEVGKDSGTIDTIKHFIEYVTDSSNNALNDVVRTNERTIEAKIVALTNARQEPPTVAVALSTQVQLWVQGNRHTRLRAAPHVVLQRYGFGADDGHARLVQVPVPTPAGYRQTLSVVRLPGRGILEAWNQHAATVQAQNRSARRATFIPELRGIEKADWRKTGWWTVAAVCDPATDNYRALTAVPIAAGSDSTPTADDGAVTVELNGIRSHTGSVPPMRLRITGQNIVAPEDALDPDALNRVVAAIAAAALLRVDGTGVPANVAFMLEPHTSNQTGGSAQVRFDELDLELRTDAAGVDGRPHFTIASGSAEAFLSATAGATRTATRAEFTVMKLRPGGDGLASRGSASDDVAPALLVPIALGTQAALFDLEVFERPRLGALDAHVTAALFAPAAPSGAATTKASTSGTAKTPAPPEKAQQGVVVALGERPSYLIGVTFRPFVQEPVASSEKRALAVWEFDPNPAPGRAGQRGWIPGPALPADGDFGWSLRLPAQGIGEEMERAGTLTDRVTSALDFRVGGPAKLEFALAPSTPGVNRLLPWNAFRAFVDPLNAQGSPTLRSAHIELLYGMACDVNADQQTGVFAVVDPVRRLGLLPLALPCTVRWSEATPRHQTEFRDAARRWREARATYTSRMLLLEPVPPSALYGWDPVVLPSSRVSCQLQRPDQVDLMHPIQPAPVPAGGVRPLRGGATWGIEHGPVFKALFQGKASEELSAVGSVDAFISELALSSFGGSGHVSAAFPYRDAAPGTPPALRISADVSFGAVTRLVYSLRGRIGVFGHPAAHVVVYERTTVPSDQFGPTQPPALTGRAILRKVAEYVEVNAPVARLAEGDRAWQAGFAAGCAFQPGARINVRSDWASDVGTIGWKVPLWNRAAAAAQPTVYPRPEVSMLLTMEHDPNGSVLERRERAVPITNPDALVFFTRTDGVDAASSEPVESVDFTLLPVPAPERPKIDASADPAQLAASLVDDPEVPTGFEPFTFSVEAGDEPALVSAHRGDSVQGVRARIRTLTIVRGEVPDALERVPPSHRQWANQVVQLGALPVQIERVGMSIERLAGTVAAASGGLGSTSVAEVLALALGTPPGQAIAWPGGVTAQARRDITTAWTTYSEGLTAATAQRSLARAQRDLRFVQQAAATMAEVRRALDAEVLREAQRLQLALDRLQRDALGILLAPIQQLPASLDRPTVERSLGDAIAGVWEIVAPYDPDKLTREIERIVSTFLEATDAWLLASTGLNSAVEARAWIARSRNWLGEASRMLAGLRPTWGVALAPLSSALNSAARAQLQRLENTLAPWQPVTFQMNVQAAATTFRTTIMARMARLGYPPLVIPAGGGAWDWLARQLEQRGRTALTRRFAMLRREALTRAAAWSYPLTRDEATAQVQKELVGLATQLPVDLPTSIGQAAGPLLDALVADLQQDLADVATPLADLTTFAGKQLRELVDAGQSIEVAVREMRDRVRAEAQAFVASVAQELKPLGDVLVGARSGARLLRALGDPPSAQDVAFVQSRLAYVFPPNDPRLIQLSTTVAQIGQAGRRLGDVDRQIRAVGFDLPVQDLRNALLKPGQDMMGKFDVNRVFADLGGMRMRALFQGIKLPELPDRIRVRHEVDPQSRRARVYADIDDLLLENGQPITVLDIGVFAIALRNARLRANISVDSVGLPPQPRQQMRGAIVADWEVSVGGSRVLTLAETRIEFAQPGGLRFDIDPTRIALAEVLQFLTDLMKTAGSNASGLVAGVIERGFEAVLSTELPALNAGSFAITNLSLGVRFALERGEGREGFAIVVGAFVGRRRAPFALTVFILGGGGFLEIDARYVIGGALRCSVALGINAAAAVGVSLGPIRGAVFAALGFALYFESGRAAALRFEIFFLLRGTVRVLSLITVAVEIELSLSYVEKRFVGQGTFRIKIKIGFFKKSVRAGIRYQLGCAQSGEFGHHALHALPVPESAVRTWATQYVTMYV
jgi:hypothetical protein